MIEAARFYSAKTVQAETGAPREMVYAALRSGDLRAIRRGRRWLVPGRCVQVWLDGIAEQDATDVVFASEGSTP